MDFCCSKLGASEHLQIYNLWIFWLQTRSERAFANANDLLQCSHHLNKKKLAWLLTKISCIFDIKACPAFIKNVFWISATMFNNISLKTLASSKVRIWTSKDGVFDGLEIFIYAYIVCRQNYFKKKNISNFCSSSIWFSKIADSEFAHLHTQPSKCWKLSKYQTVHAIPSHIG